MDTDEKQVKENELAVIEAYLNHPISREILKDNEEQQTGLVNIICEHDITDLGTFFAHFAAVGELRGLRRARVGLEGKAEELREIIANL